MESLHLNLACGETFVEGPNWINLDYAPASPAVRQADLLARLPFESDTFDTVYSSHFLEHIPRNCVDGFLSECLRILKPGGIIRLVLPDFEEMCCEYLAKRQSGEHDKADFVIIEIIDQCVRTQVGGELGETYQRLAGNPDRYPDLINYVRQRNGETLGLDCTDDVSGNNHCIDENTTYKTRLIAKMRIIKANIKKRVYHIWFEWLIAQLPSVFRIQNVSFTSIGERHHWLWDFHQLALRLKKSGYSCIERMDAKTSNINGFPFYPLDVNGQGLPRKGAESMYVEAHKS